MGAHGGSTRKPRPLTSGKRGLAKLIGLIKPVKKVPFDWYVPWESYHRPTPLAAQVAASGEAEHQMNWRRGLFRIWMFGTVLLVLAVASVFIGVLLLIAWPGRAETPLVLRCSNTA